MPKKKTTKKTKVIHGSKMPSSAPLTGLGEADLVYPIYKEPFSITLILNNDAFPIMDEPEVQDATTQMISTYVERVNGYRLLAEQRAAIEIDRERTLIVLHEAERKLAQEKAQMMLRKAEETDPKGKPKYGAEYKLKAAVEAAVSTDPSLAKLDEVAFNARQDVRGFGAKLESLRQHMSAHREEIVASRDAISHLVNSGLVAVAGLPTEEDLFDESEPVDDDDAG